MTTQEKIDKFCEESGLPAVVNEDGSVSVDEGMMTRAKWETFWLHHLEGLDVKSLKLCGIGVADAELGALNQCKSIKLLNVRDSPAITGSFLHHLRTDIGLEEIDVAATEVGGDTLPVLCRFPQLKQVWGHRGQFSESVLNFARQSRPDLTIKLLP